MRRVRLLLWLALAALATSPPAAAGPLAHVAPVLHEPIPPDAREDLALRVSLEGDLPAALQTPSGLVSAPDPRQPPTAAGVAYGDVGSGSFAPDRNTSRPSVSGYDEPFTPSTAPFKRLEAYDAVRPDYELTVRDNRRTPVLTNSGVGPEDEAFYADVVVDAVPDRDVRIPSVGPGARIVRARLGVGDQDIPFRVVRDAADNWFLQTPALPGGTRARLVMEIAIVRGAFGGIADRAWGELPLVPPLPEDVARDAAQVRAAIGVSRRLSPRDAIAKLVQYFRGFVESEDPPQGRRSIYLDLALSKKGVCRHRAFAFLVTALSLGIPTRMVLNEAHAWVEVHDGILWRRIDLGGAGRMGATTAAISGRPVYRPPPDAFAWPQSAEGADDMLADARSRLGASGGAAAASDPSGSGTDGMDTGSAALSAAAGSTAEGASHAPPGSPRDDRPSSTVSLSVGNPDAHRGLPLHVRGEVRADGEPCVHVAVDVSLRDVKTAQIVRLGTVATGDDGTFADGIVIPAGVPVGDYDVVARSHGDARCADGESK